MFDDTDFHVMTLDADLLVSHRVFLILPFHLRQIHAAIVRFSSLLPISILDKHPNTHARTIRNTENDITERACQTTACFINNSFVVLLLLLSVIKTSHYISHNENVITTSKNIFVFCSLEQ